MSLIPGFATVPRGLLALIAAWLMFPHQPDVGFGRPAAIESLATTTPVDNCAALRGTTCDGAVFDAMLGSIADMERSRNALLDSIARVKSDLRANGTRTAASLRNRAL